jgi:RNA polymerase sigma factor (sigma-70 family)
VPASVIPLSSLSEIRAAAPTARSTAAGASPDIGALTGQLAAGSEAAFREFHARYFDRLYHFLLIVTGGKPHAAQEALQETLLRVARYARRFDAEEVFWSWLKAVARSAVHDAGRRQRRYFALLERFARKAGLIDAAQADREDERLEALIETSLAELAVEDRDLLVGKYLEGASVLELAEKTGLSEKAVESRLLRARRELAGKILQRLGKS